MIKVAICDDNLCIIESIRRVCLNHYKQHNVELFMFTSGEQLLQSNKRFDLIFMDVEMENMNGIETVREIRKTDIHVLIVMLSEHPRFKLEAFPLHVFDFLDKPVIEDKIMHVLREVDKYFIKDNKNKYVTFKIKDRYINLNIDDIYYFCHENRKVKIYSSHGIFELYESLSELVKRLNCFGFSQPHQSFIINLRYVLQLAKTEVILMNNTVIPISRYKGKQFSEECLQFIREEFHLF